MKARRVVEIGLLAFALGGPLVYAPFLGDLRLREMYRYPKYALLAFVAAPLLWAAALSARRAGGIPALPLFWPVVAYVVVTLASLTQAVNLYEGAFDSARMIIALGFFWLTAVFLTRPAAILRLFHWASLGALLVSLPGIAQVWGVAVPSLPLTPGGPGSTFGNVNFAAHYLLLVLPMAYARLLLADPGPAQWLRALVAALPTAYLSYTGTRSAWAGLAIGVVVLGPLLALKRVRLGVPWRATLPALAAVAAFVAAMHLVPAMVTRDFGQSRYSPVARLGTLLEPELQETGARFRVAVTANTLVMFRDHPILGVGKGNLEMLYPLYARAAIVDPIYGPRSRIDEAHNDYAQLLAETGILGFAAFAWVLFGLARRFLKSLSSLPDDVPRLLAIATAFALLSLLGDALFDFPFALPVPSGLFWILAGVLWSATEVRPDRAPPAARRRQKGHVLPRPPWTPVAAFGLLALVATATAAWTVQVLRADYHFSRGFWAAAAGRVWDAKRASREAVRLNPFNDRYWHMSGLYHLETRDYEAAVADISRALALNPHHIGSLNNLGAAYLFLNKLPEAVRTLETAVKIWPDLREARMNLARAYLRLGRQDLAVAQFREIARLRQKAGQPREPAPATPAEGLGASPTPGG